MTANPEIPQQHAPYRDTGQATVDWRPIPDPTKLTTEQLRRELATLREIIETRLNAMDRATELATAQAVVIGQQIEQTRDRLREETAADVRQLRELLETRLDGMDRAIRLHAEIIDRVPAERDTAIKPRGSR